MGEDAFPPTAASQRILLRMHVEYFKYVIRHKWFVFIECCHFGLWWRGIIHDWSKFLPCEWLPYVRKFDMPEQPSVQDFHGDVRFLMEQSGFRFREDVDRQFDEAWLHHQHLNKHHWQYWVLRNDDGTTRAMEMPWVYMAEMLADWKGAGRALGFPDTADWYQRNRERIVLHDETRTWVEEMLA